MHHTMSNTANSATELFPNLSKAAAHGDNAKLTIQCRAQAASMMG